MILFGLHASPGNHLFYQSLRTCFGPVAGQAQKPYDFCLMRYSSKPGGVLFQFKNKVIPPTRPISIRRMIGAVRD